MADKTISGKNWFFAPLLAFVVFRIALLFILYKVSGGSEFTSDIFVFNLGLHPLSVITFSTDASLYSQPPLFPLLLAPFALILSQITTQFLASRISYSALELIAFLLSALYLSKSEIREPKFRRSVLLFQAFSPIGFMTGTIMCEEEAIVAIFTVLVLLAVQADRVKLASFLVILGLLAGKILFGIVFVPLLFLRNHRKDVINYGILPALALMAFYMIIGYRVTGVIPFLGFSPGGIPFCSSIFNIILYFVPLSGPFMKWASLVLLASVLCLLYLKIKSLERDKFPFILLIVFCAMFVVFYHVNVEYYIFALPLLAISPYLSNYKKKRGIISAANILLGISAWGYAVSYGLRIYSLGGSDSSHSKDIALAVYKRLLGFMPLPVFEISLLVSTILMLGVIGVITYKSLLEKSAANISN
jgi:hypothetical protein